jgi:hypothetical protein
MIILPTARFDKNLLNQRVGSPHLKAIRFNQKDTASSLGLLLVGTASIRRIGPKIPALLECIRLMLLFRSDDLDCNLSGRGVRFASLGLANLGGFLLTQAANGIFLSRLSRLF